MLFSALEIWLHKNELAYRFCKAVMKNIALSDSKSTLNWPLIVIGLVALALGVVLYIYDRPASLIYFVPDFLSQYEGKPMVFGIIGYHMPAFLHVFAFCLISVGTLRSELGEALVICLFWLIVDGLFEVAQYQDIAYEIVPFIPDWFKGIPVLENMADYLMHGRFDPADLVATLCGAVTAYLLIFVLHVRSQKYKFN